MTRSSVSPSLTINTDGSVPAPAAELTDAQRLAESIICELISEAEFDDIGDRLEDDLFDLTPSESDQLHGEVADLISKATVTVSWDDTTTT